MGRKSPCHVSSKRALPVNLLAHHELVGLTLSASFGQKGFNKALSFHYSFTFPCSVPLHFLSLCFSFAWGKELEVKLAKSMRTLLLLRACSFLYSFTCLLLFLNFPLLSFSIPLLFLYMSFGFPFFVSFSFPLLFKAWEGEEHEVKLAKSMCTLLLLHVCSFLYSFTFPLHLLCVSFGFPLFSFVFLCFSFLFEGLGGRS